MGACSSTITPDSAPPPAQAPSDASEAAAAAGTPPQPKLQVEAASASVPAPDPAAEVQQTDPADLVRYTGGESVWEALTPPESGLTRVRLLKASYLMQLAGEGGRLRRRQELPEDAFITVDELKKLYGKGNKDGVLPIIAISFCWDTPPDPDPRGKQLATVAAALNREMPKYKQLGFTDMGVFWDWAVLFQKDPVLFELGETPESKPEGPERDAFIADLKTKSKFYGGATYENSRSEEEKAAFDSALKETMDLWYAHQGTTVYMLTQLPKGTNRKVGYDASGWTTYERRSAEQIKKFYLFDAKWKLVLDLGAGENAEKARNWPLDPDGFDELIEEKQFTNGADKGAVKALFRKMSVAQLGGIKMLDFDGFKAPTIEDAQQLGRCLNLCQNLESCDLRQVGITGEACAALFSTLKFNAAVNKLFLTSNKIGDAGAKAIGDALVVNTALKELRLSSNQIGDEGAAAIGEALKFNTALNKLGLSSNQIGAEGAKALASALEVNSALNTLGLDHNEFGDAGAAAIGEALRFNTALNKLYLNSNKIGDAGAKAIGDALVVNTALKTLSLWSNEIGDSGATAIANALVVNTALNKLLLGCNQIGDSGAKAIGDALVVNSALKILVLEDNKIGSEGAKALASALEVNTALKTLSLQFNNLTDDGKRALRAAKEQRSAPLELGL